MMPQGDPTVVLVASSKNIASANMAQRLLDRHGFKSTDIVLGEGRPVYQRGSLLLTLIDTELVNPPDLDSFFNPQAYIFLSTHRSESGIAAVTAHTTGNFSGEARLGGRPREVGISNPDLLKNYMIALKRREASLEGYDITIEATHHGPTSLRRAVMFVEMGASEANWRDEGAAAAVTDALVESLSEPYRRSWEKVALAFGGTHYSDKFNNVLLESDLALASVVPKYLLPEIDPEMFGQLIQKSTRSPRYAALDWKGMGKEKERIISLAAQFGLEVVRA